MNWSLFIFQMWKVVVCSVSKLEFLNFTSHSHWIFFYEFNIFWNFESGKSFFSVIFCLWLVHGFPRMKLNQKDTFYNETSPSVLFLYSIWKIGTYSRLQFKHKTVYFQVGDSDTLATSYQNRKSKIGCRNYFSLTLLPKATDFVSLFRLPKNSFYNRKLVSVVLFLRPKKSNRLKFRFW